MELHPHTDSRIRYSGRHIVENGAVRFAASGFTIRFRVLSDAVAVILRDEERGGNRNAFTVMVDGEEVGRFQMEKGRTRYLILEGLGREARLVELIKDTEGQNGWTDFLGIEADSLSEAPAPPSRRIEFVGDSITCGYGMDNATFPCERSLWFEPTRASTSYAMRLGRRFNAESILTAVSGIGMYRNWNSDSPVMPDRYDGVFADYAVSQPAWDHARFNPDLIVIALGTNDFSDGDGLSPRAPFDPDAFRDTYTAFVERLRMLHPGSAFLLVASPTLDESRLAVQTALLRAIPGVAVATFSARYVGGCNGHPDMAEHIRMADELEPVIINLMDWK